MVWKIEFERHTQRELDALGSEEAKRILRYLRDRVAIRDDPRSLGAPLSGAALGEYWRYRIGDYRVVAQIRDEVRLLAIIRVGHRRNIYDS